MKRYLAIVLAVIAGSLASVLARADTPASMEMMRANLLQKKTFGYALNGLGDTLAGAVSAGPRNDGVLKIGSEDKRATLTYSLQSPDSITNLILSTPLGSNDRSTLATLDGFNNDYTFKIVHKWGNLPDDESLSENIQSLYDSRKSEAGGDRPFPGVDALSSSALGMFSAVDTYESHNLASKAASKLWEDGWFYGFTAEIGRKEYKYHDEITFAERSSDLQQWSISGFVGWFYSESNVLTFDVKNVTSYEQGRKGALCSFPAPGSNIFCPTGILGEPKKNRKNVLTLTMQKVFEQQQIAVSPSIQYDLENDISAVSIPIFLNQSDPEGQQDDPEYVWGVEVGWRSDTEDVTATLFVGKELGIFD